MKVVNIRKIINFIKKKYFVVTQKNIEVNWIKKDLNSWLYLFLGEPIYKPVVAKKSEIIEKLARNIDKMGPLPLWEGYDNFLKSKRRANEVRISSIFGNFFSSLVIAGKPEIIVEFGAAFGVSGMYFLSGLESNQYGKLFTFEPNKLWAEIALKNLSIISDRFKLIVGTFEEKIDSTLINNQKIDIAFIDAIHKSEFVWPQFQLVTKNLNSNGLILFDDVNFTPDMASCWHKIAQHKNVIASAELSKRMGIIQYI